MKKTLVISLGRTGSLPIYAETLVENFQTLNYDILVSKYRSVKTPLKNAIEITTYYDKKSFILNSFFVLPFLFFRFLPKIYKNYDTLYLPYKHFWDIPFILIFRFFGKKIYFTVHDGLLHKGERNLITQGLNNFRLKSATKLVFLTSYVERLVSQTLKITKPYYIVPHPIIENKYVTFDNKVQKTKNILFLGRIDKYKGVELLMNSIFYLENKIDKLIIAGKSLYDINYIKHQKIEIIDKYLSEIEIGELLSWADILVLPYTEATQSGVISLGIYAELPMVCTNVGGFNEQLNDDECFWCEPNKKDLARVILESIENVDKRNYIISQFRQKKKELSWKNISLDIENKIKNNNNGA